MLTGYRLREKSEQYAKRIAALSHPHRLGILHLLADRAMGLAELCSCIDISPSLALHHIGILMDSGWVIKEGSGRTCLYRLANRPFGFFVRFFADTAEERRRKPVRHAG